MLKILSKIINKWPANQHMIVEVAMTWKAKVWRMSLNSKSTKWLLETCVHYDLFLQVLDSLGCEPSINPLENIVVTSDIIIQSIVYFLGDLNKNAFDSDYYKYL